MSAVWVRPPIAMGVSAEKLRTSVVRINFLVVSAEKPPTCATVLFAGVRVTANKLNVKIDPTLGLCCRS